MKKLKTSIIEKIDSKIPSGNNFKNIKKRLTYTHVAPKYVGHLLWLRGTLTFVAIIVLLFSLTIFFKNNYINEITPVEEAGEVKLLSWDENVYCLGETIYIDYPMLTTYCNLDNKMEFTENHWEVFKDNNQIDKTNVPLNFGINTFTIYEKSLDEDKKLYTLNILVGRNVKNLNINSVDNFNIMEANELPEQVINITSFLEFEEMVFNNNFDTKLLYQYSEKFFSNNDLLIIVSKNNIDELTYQKQNEELFITMIGDETRVNKMYIIPVSDSLEDVESYNVELFTFDTE